MITADDFEMRTDMNKTNPLKQILNGNDKPVSEAEHVIVRKYLYTKDGKTRTVTRKYTRKSDKPYNPRGCKNVYPDLVKYCQGISPNDKRTYKQITEDFNKQFHCNYHLTSVYHVINKIDPRKRETKRINNENLIRFLKETKWEEVTNLLKLLRTYNKEYNDNVKETKFRNFVSIVCPNYLELSKIRSQKRTNQNQTKETSRVEIGTNTMESKAGSDAVDMLSDEIVLESVFDEIRSRPDPSGLVTHDSDITFTDSE